MNFFYLIILTLFTGCETNMETREVICLSSTVYSEISLEKDKSVAIDKGSSIEVLEVLQPVKLGIFNGEWYKIRLNDEIYFVPSFMTTDYLFPKELNLENLLIINDLDYYIEKEDYSYSKGTYQFDNCNVASIYYLMKFFLNNLELPATIEKYENVDSPIIKYNIKNNEIDYLDIRWEYDGGIIELLFKSSGNGVLVTLIEDRD